jgi:hypothetical protein
MTGSCVVHDRLAGLVFATEGRWCRFRTAFGQPFNYPLNDAEAYAVIDIETGTFLGVHSTIEFTGPTSVPIYRVYMLRPLTASVP